MNETKIGKNTIGNAGEHFVAAELERRNFTTSVVGNNCKGYDIIAVNNFTHKEVLIQVKATSKNKKKWLVDSNILVKDNLFYVLVNIKDDKPKYYILASQEADRLKEKNHKEFCERNGYDINDKKHTMREIVLDDEQLNKCLNNWEIIYSKTK